MTETSIIPVFFATDENYVPYLGVSLQSLIAHTAHNKQYEIYILHDSLSEHARQQLREFKQKNVNISFLKVSNTNPAWKTIWLSGISRPIIAWLCPCWQQTTTKFFTATAIRFSLTMSPVSTSRTSKTTTCLRFRMPTTPIIFPNASNRWKRN